MHQEKAQLKCVPMSHHRLSGWELLAAQKAALALLNL